MSCIRRKHWFGMISDIHITDILTNTICIQKIGKVYGNTIFMIFLGII